MVCDLNSRSITNKLYQLKKLQSAGVTVPDFCEASTSFPRIAPKPGWMPRTLHHARAGDFRRGVRNPDYWVAPLDITEEKRLHVFRRPKGSYVVIRTATKKPIEGKETHPWVRSHETGWRFSYGGGSNPSEREVAIQAVDALGLDFGAVDIGIVNSAPLVLEVNTCPGLEGTLTYYVEEIKRHANSV